MHQWVTRKFKDLLFTIPSDSASEADSGNLRPDSASEADSGNLRPDSTSSVDSGNLRRLDDDEKTLLKRKLFEEIYGIDVAKIIGQI